MATGCAIVATRTPAASREEHLCSTNQQPRLGVSRCQRYAKEAGPLGAVQGMFS